jgi:hypothetical protein
MAERGPEMVDFGGGKTALVTNPGFYQVPSAGKVYTAAQTRRMMARSVPGTPGTAPKKDPAIGKLDKIHKAIESRKAEVSPTINVGRGDDRNVDRVLRSLIRSRW